ncbi:hypothetical protein KIN20_028084 [Parelaphostrongylus tenuis]|uniref:Calcineurin-like phosphoesterase domain-containing protein n=1 Tax=Parelaphostrongylus tenuis TaxID=148309 RepID=A0AAD5WEC8_PARTN|nr:hypothetical protein KIN20_028084 [Parelaphostrongylus tenuis]
MPGVLIRPCQRLKELGAEEKLCQLDTTSLSFEQKVRIAAFLSIIPDGDVLIHAGDFTNYGDLGQVIKFNAEIGRLPHKYKLVVPGNHELGFEDGEDMNEKQLAGLSMLGINKAYDLLSNCTYLCDRSIEVYGIKVYGAPWHSMPGYSFYRPRGQKMLHKWNQIPTKIDVLITHIPPLGHGDFNSWNKMDGILAGDVELLNSVEQRIMPKYHVFGHVHQMHGATTNGITTFINASLCDHQLRSAYDPIIFDLPLPSGVTK